MTLLIKVATNTIHFSDIHFQLRADTKWCGILILLLYLAVQLDLLTGIEAICNVHGTMCKEDSLRVPFVTCNSEVVLKGS